MTRAWQRPSNANSHVKHVAAPDKALWPVLGDIIHNELNSPPQIKKIKTNQGSHYLWASLICMVQHPHDGSTLNEWMMSLCEWKSHCIYPWVRNFNCLFLFHCRITTAAPGGEAFLVHWQWGAMHRLHQRGDVGKPSKPVGALLLCSAALPFRDPGSLSRKQEENYCLLYPLYRGLEVWIRCTWNIL